MNMTHEGTARCSMIQGEEGLAPDMLAGCTFRLLPLELVCPTPTPEAPEGIVEFSTEGDRLSELEAHAGILYIFEYGEIT